MSDPLPEVKDVIPHREPFLFVDRVLELTPTLIRAVRFFSAQEPFFNGHFPNRPVVPGVLLVEGLAQTLAYAALIQDPGAPALLVSIEKARFLAPVPPDTEVTYELELEEERFGLRSARGVVRVGTSPVAEASLRGLTGGKNPFTPNP